MKRYFETRLEAIDWIAQNAEDEGQFEVLREQLNFNYIYNNLFFIETTKEQLEVVLLNHNKSDH